MSVVIGRKGVFNLKLKLINIGYGNFVLFDRIVGVTAPDSLPIKRFLKAMLERKPEMYIDATFGKKKRSVITMDSGHVYISAVHPNTLAVRLITAYGDDEDRGLIV